MRKISAILPVYNEESLLGLCMKQIDPYVDEIVVVDGGPDGPSDDRTAEIAQSFDKTKYISGIFKTIPGYWDEVSQKNRGIAEASGDVFLFLSADMLFYNLEYMCDIIRKEINTKIFFCNTIEFWMDTKHIRVYAPIGNLSLPGGVSEAVAISRESQPVLNENMPMEIITPKPKEQMLVSDTKKFHLGWIRPFNKQVEKHITHIRQGRWKKSHPELMEGSEQKLYQWVLLHVLSYRQNPSIEFRTELPEEWDSIKNMNCMDGQNEVIKNYETKYGRSFLRGVK